MKKIGDKQLFELSRFMFNAGLKRSSTLSDKILKELLEEWIEKNMKTV